MGRAFLLAVLAYVVPTFALGYAWHLHLFRAGYRELGIYRRDILVPFGFAAMLIQGVILAAVWLRLAAAPTQMSQGIRFAAAAALFAWTFTTLAVAAKHPMTSVGRYLVLETAFTVAQYVLVGPLLVLAARAARA